MVQGIHVASWLYKHQARTDKRDFRVESWFEFRVWGLGFRLFVWEVST